MSSKASSQIEEALVSLIAELEGDDFDQAAVQAGERATRAIESTPPASLTPEEQKRVKRLHSLAITKLMSRRGEIETELRRVADARQLLKRCMRSGSESDTGGDLNIRG